jgi:hypothetical protein
MEYAEIPHSVAIFPPGHYFSEYYIPSDESANADIILDFSVYHIETPEYSDHILGLFRSITRYRKESFTRPGAEFHENRVI